MVNTKLSERERRFVEAFLDCGVATQAARSAGFKHPHVLGHRQLRKIRVQKAIARRTELREKAGIASAEERDLLASKLMRDEGLDPTARARFMAELNKVEGRYSVTFKGRISLEEIVGGSNPQESHDGDTPGAGAAGQGEDVGGRNEVSRDTERRGQGPARGTPGRARPRKR